MTNSVLWFLKHFKCNTNQLKKVNGIRRRMFKAFKSFQSMAFQTWVSFLKLNQSTYFIYNTYIISYSSRSFHTCFESLVFILVLFEFQWSCQCCFVVESIVSQYAIDFFYCVFSHWVESSWTIFSNELLKIFSLYEFHLIF